MELAHLAAVSPRDRQERAAVSPRDSNGVETDPKSLSDAERLRRFGDELDAIKARVEAEIGEEDLAYVKRMNRFSRTMEVIGRVLIHVSPEPITWGAGVI